MPTYRAVVTIDHASLGGRGTNTWHLRSASTVVGSVIEVNAMMENVKDFYEAISGVFPTGTAIRFDGQFAGVGDDEGEFGAGDAWTATLIGSGSPLPPSQCVCVNWRGQSGDRSRRGRTFIGPLNTDTLESNGTVTESTLTVCRNAAAALVGQSQGFNDGAIGIWSRQEQTFRDVVGSQITDKFAVLRSRRD